MNQISESKIMLVSRIKEKELTFEAIDRLLYYGIDDTSENADCIIVLGSTKAAEYRVPVAVDAYKAGRARKILLCGGTLRDFPNGKCSEAEQMCKAALDLGVPEESLLLENDSKNTIENLLFALTTLQKTLSINDIRSVLLVTTAFHMRRSLAIARRLFPEHIAIHPCPANDKNTRRDNWMNTPAGIERVKGEVANIVRCVNNGIFPDFEF